MNKHEVLLPLSTYIMCNIYENCQNSWRKYFN